MDKRVLADWFLTGLTVGSFLAAVSTFVVACVDFMGGSTWAAGEFELSILCGLAFVSTIRSYRFDDSGS